MIIFLESTIKLIAGIFDFQKNNSYHDGTSAFFRCFFFEKDPHLNADVTEMSSNCTLHIIVEMFPSRLVI